MTPLTRLADSLAFLVQFLEHQVKSSTSPKGLGFISLVERDGEMFN